MGIPPRTYGALQVKLRESLVTRALVMPIQRFIHIQGISSVFLLSAAVIALAWANSPWHDSYHHVWEMELTLSRLQLPVHEWINDALMAIFRVVGLVPEEGGGGGSGDAGETPAAAEKTTQEASI